MSYLYQFLPIVIGIGIMYLAMSVKFFDERVFIDTSTDNFESHNQKFDKMQYLSVKKRFPVAHEELYGSEEYPQVVRTNILCIKYAKEEEIQWNGWISDDDDIKEALFKRIIYENALIRGIKLHSNYDIKNKAFNVFHYSDLQNIDKLEKRLSTNRTSEIKLFVTERDRFLERMKKFNPSTGYLLGFLFNDNANVQGIGNELFNN